MAQIIRITSEALQATIRRLLPSQVGFGEDLQASNVITPIIDLTPTAEGSALPLDLSTALAHSSNTAFDVSGTNTDIVTTTGFYRIFGVSTCQISNTGNRQTFFRINDGTTATIIWGHDNFIGINNEIVAVPFDFVVFLRSGDTLNASSDAGCILKGSSRQIADVYGNITNPSGFTFE